MKNIFNNLVFRISAGIIILIVAVFVSIIYFSSHKSEYNTSIVTRQNLTQTISATGKVVPEDDVSLSFDLQGKISSVNVKVGDVVHKGDILASLDSGMIRASLAGAQADVESAEARLSTTKKGTRPEELAIYIQKYSDASSALISSMKSNYLEVENAIVGKADSLFSNGDTVNPTLNINVQSETEKTSINQDRIALRDALNRWKNALSSINNSYSQNISTSSLDNLRVISNDAISNAKSFLDRLGTAANNLTPGNSGQLQTIIDSERAIVNSAAQQVSIAMTSEQSSESTWSTARDTLILEQSGSTLEDIQVQSAALSKSQAALLGIQTQYAHSFITAPFDGIITSVNIKVGEVYVPGISANEGIGLQSDSNFKFEVYVPETDIGKIASQNPATVTLDAYGSDKQFVANVSLVDPAPTAIQGINSYKVTLTFNIINGQNDPNLKSGLAGNAIIITGGESDVLAVPTSAIITRENNQFVLLKNGNNFVESEIVTGITGSDGYTQIISGLNEGDNIASFGNNQ